MSYRIHIYCSECSADDSFYDLDAPEAKGWLIDYEISEDKTGELCPACAKRVIEAQRKEAAETDPSVVICPFFGKECENQYCTQKRCSANENDAAVKTLGRKLRARRAKVTA